jgi:hypothetical protein
LHVLFPQFKKKIEWFFEWLFFNLLWKMIKIAPLIQK